MSLQVIGAGFGRTGTLSFKKALEVLGFGPCHHMMEIHRAETVPVEAWKAAAAGTLTDWDQLYGDWGSVCDFPHCVFYEELAAFYPYAKVVLTTRDSASWFASVSNTIFRPENLDRFAQPPASDGAVVDSAELLRPVLADVISKVVDIRHGLDEAAMISAFERHNAQVIDRIPADRLLVYPVGSGWEPLCSFLGVPVPDVPYPNTNSTQEFRARFAERAAASDAGDEAGSATA